MYQLEDEEFKQLIASTLNIRQILKKMGLSDSPTYYRYLRKRCEELNISPPKKYNNGNDELLMDYEKRKIITNNDIIQACSVNISRRSVLKHLGLNCKIGVNIKWINDKIKKLNIDTAHWLGSAYLKGKTHSRNKKIPIADILVINGPFAGTTYLKKRLINDKVLDKSCSRCGISNWMDESISLHLHHINGNREDNRLENLQLLCPNCHSQTSTYCGKKNKNNNKNSAYSLKITCKTCGAIICDSATCCKKCFAKTMEKIHWPPTNELIKMINDSNYVQVGKLLGVTDKAIKKRIKNHPND